MPRQLPKELIPELTEYRYTSVRHLSGDTFEACYSIRVYDNASKTTSVVYRMYKRIGLEEAKACAKEHNLITDLKYLEAYPGLPD